MKKRKFLSTKTMVLLSASALLLVGSAVGSTSATLNYTSDEYIARMRVSEIGVSLNENGKTVVSDGAEGQLLEHLKDENVIPGKLYTEELSVTNSGDIATYVRVILTKSWTKPESNEKCTELSPNLIELECLKDNGWFLDETASTEERMILYYSQPIDPGETSNPLTESLKIKSEIGEQVESGNDNGTMTYKYDGYQFNLKAEVDSVQKNNAEDAIKSAWGVDVSLDGDTMSISERQ